MEKLKMHTPDLTQKNIAKIQQIFPSCVTEAKDAQGNVTLAIDFDQLKQELSGQIVETNQERYHLNWPGKREALITANAPIAKTLRPVREESVDFDTTKNLFIEGDNLDALKLLQETYLGKVKMIYIDPPYNTGRDFLYDDDYADDFNAFLLKSNQMDDSGAKLVANTESNGRFHSDWLSMMYSRVKLAHNLLSDRGVIFISIDDVEVSNLRKLCDEIFGENQFVAQIIWKKRNTPPNDRVIGAQHDYILAYVKNDLSAFNLRARSEEQIARYKNIDDHPKGPWVAGDLTANVKGGRYTPTLYFPIVNPNSGKAFYPPNNGNWRFNKEKIAKLMENDEIYFGKDGDSSPKLKRFLSDVKDGTTWTTLWDFAPLNTSGSNEMSEIFGNSVLFENPKPVGLIKLLIEAGSDKDSIVLDFFGGSGTTAHAVMEKNKEDGGSRKFIVVQIPDPCDKNSEAFKAGFGTIADIGKERIRRVGKKIQEDTGNANIDIGFRVLKVDTSNMADNYYTPEATQQTNLFDAISTIKFDRNNPEELLFQVLLDWGIDLTLPITKENIQGKDVFFVDNNAIAACFEKGITENFVREIAGRNLLRVAFLDVGFESDSIKINIEQIFKQLSSSTEVKSI